MACTKSLLNYPQQTRHKEQAALIWRSHGAYLLYFTSERAIVGLRGACAHDAGKRGYFARLKEYLSPYYFIHGLPRFARMERPTEEERRVLEFLPNSALARQAYLIKKESGMASELGRVMAEIQNRKDAPDR